MTPEQRAQIMDVYLTSGFTAAAPLAVQFGAAPKAMSKWARAIGHKGTRGREPGVWKTTTDSPKKSLRPITKKYPRKYGPKVDPRWQWAIERGEVRI